MYESPIKLNIDNMCTQLITQQEDNVYKVAQQYGINVDKEELIMALRYDRKQYDKGYVDAVVEFEERLKAGLIEGGIYPVLVKNTINRVKNEMIGESQ